MEPVLAAGLSPGPEPRSCGGGFLNSSWQESRGSIGVSSSRRVLLKWYVNPDAGYPSIIARRVYRPDARTAMEALPGIIRANDDPSWG